MRRASAGVLAMIALVSALLPAHVVAQEGPTPASPSTTPGGVTPPADYVLGTDDVLIVIFWREKDMSSEVVVRPDGKITLPLLNDVVAAGLTPDALRKKLNAEASRFIEDPAASVVVKVINSRKVFVTGEVQKPGPYPLTTPTTVMQLLAIAGGLKDYAKRNEIVVMRTENGEQVLHAFDYDAIIKRKKVSQNILLEPGDTIVVP
jgi:polysaccharide biosynthesis/export protein